MDATMMAAGASGTATPTSGGAPGRRRWPGLPFHGQRVIVRGMVLDDTAPEVRTRQFDRLRQMTEGERVAMAMELTRVATHLSRQAVRESMPGASEQDVLLRWIELTYGPELARGVAPLKDRLGRGAAP